VDWRWNEQFTRLKIDLTRNVDFSSHCCFPNKAEILLFAHRRTPSLGPLPRLPVAFYKEISYYSFI
jgi:hypothetical protein